MDYIPNVIRLPAIDMDIARNIYLHIDVPMKLMYYKCRRYRKATMENRKLLYIWPHWCLLAAIKNTDFYLFAEIIEDIIDDISEEQIFHSSYVNLIDFFNPILGDTYLNIVRNNGLKQFERFLIRRRANFNRTNGILYNIPLPYATENERIDMLAVFLGETMHLERNLDISLHIAVRRNDLICAHMLLKTGACADMSYNDGITALHLAALKGNVDMIRLIFSESQQPLDIDSYKDYDNHTTRRVIQNLLGLSFLEDLQIFPINEQILKFYLNNNDEIRCLTVMNEKFHGELSYNLSKELLNIAIRRNFYKIIRDILGKFKNPIKLNVFKNTAVIYGNHAVLHELLKFEPEITNDLVMNAYRLLKVSTQEISNETRNNTSARLKCLKLILEPGNINVYTNDTHNDWVKSHTEFMIRQYKEDSKADEVMIHKILEEINTENDEFYEQFNHFKITNEDKSVENHLSNLNYFCNPCRLYCPTDYSTSYSLKYTKIKILKYTDDQKIYMLHKILEIIRQELCYNNRAKFLDLLASLLEQITINPNLNRALNNALKIAVRMNDLICAYMLLCKGASANDPTIGNMTALQLAARNGNADMVELIMMKSRQQPQNFKSYMDEHNWTMREIILQNLSTLSCNSNFLEILPPIKEQTLKFFLNNSDEIKCLKIMKEGFQGELSLSVAEELLNIAMRRNYYVIIKSILGKLNKSPISLNEVKTTAVLWDNHVMLRKLLKLQPEVTNDLIPNACQQLKIPPAEVNDTSDRLECLKLILKHVDVCRTDDRGNTPLHYVLEANCYEAAILLLEQDRSRYLGHVNKSNNNINIANIPAFILSNYFNDCIQLKGEWTDEYTIEFDYRCLMPRDDLEEQRETYQTTREMEVILCIADNDNLKHLLKHPLLSSFLYVKWYRIRHVLYANFVFYVMFYFLMNIYVLSTIYDIPSSKSEEHIADDTNIWQGICHDMSWWVLGGMLFLFSFQEILQFVVCPRWYLTENWSQALLIVLALALLCGAGIQIGVMIILLSTWKLVILMISHHLFLPTSSATEMFRTVLFNFVRIFSPYLFLIIAFALTFYMLFKNDKFSNPCLSLFKTIIMLAGEFGFEKEDTSFTAYPISSRIVFALFIFNIIIVLVNLLNGLAISNIAEILNKAEIIGLISRVRLIVYLERMIVGKPFCWNSHWKWWNPFNFLFSRILLFSHFKNGKICLKPNDNLIVYDSDMHVNGKSKDKCYDKRWSTLKMDSNIIKRVKQIVYDKTDPSNNDLLYKFNKLQNRLSQTNSNLKQNLQ